MKNPWRVEEFRSYLEACWRDLDPIQFEGGFWEEKMVGYLDDPWELLQYGKICFIQFPSILDWLDDVRCVCSYYSWGLKHNPSIVPTIILYNCAIDR